jgi:hypothetical protein
MINRQTPKEYQGVRVLDFVYFTIQFYCRGGDDTQREADADLPLDSLGAANQVLTCIHRNIFDVSVMMAHPCAALLLPSSLMAIREYCLSFRHLIQADLVLVDR